MTGQRNRDEILDPIVRPSPSAVGEGFILMHDNARPHTARSLHLDHHGIEVMDWPSRPVQEYG